MPSVKKQRKVEEGLSFSFRDLRIWAFTDYQMTKGFTRRAQRSRSDRRVK
jgi:hypothetical protein